MFNTFLMLKYLKYLENNNRIRKKALNMMVEEFLLLLFKLKIKN